MTGHYCDAIRVFEVQHGVIDMEYLERWAGLIEVEDLLRRVMSEAEPI